MGSADESQYGRKLQRLVKEGLFADDHVKQLSPTHRSAIEGLSDAEIDTLVSVHKKVGRVPTSQFI